MKLTHQLSFGLGLMLAAGLSMNALAQNQSVPMQPMHPMPPGAMFMQGMIPPQMTEQRMAQMQSRRAEHRSKRLQELKVFLQLQDNQEADWSTFSAALQTTMTPPSPMNPAEIEKLTTPERIDKMMVMKAAREAQINSRMNAVKTFYASLNPQQQKVFDTHASKAMKRHGMGPGHRG
jgi:hypothetical protein